MLTLVRPRAKPATIGPGVAGEPGVGAAVGHSNGAVRSEEGSGQLFIGSGQYTMQGLGYCCAPTPDACHSKPPIHVLKQTGHANNVPWGFSGSSCVRRRLSQAI